MIRVRQIEINIDNNNIDEIKKQVAIKLKINSNFIDNLIIVKQSIDARKKDSIHYVYEVDVKINKEKEIILKNKNNDIFKSPIEKYVFSITGKKKMSYRPIIVGSGPAGLFCAYLLSENGYKPIIIERGEDIDNRVNTVNNFWKTGNLNENSNVQFGEGGAGTFSDGKLNTLIKDKEFRGKKVFEIFIKNGASPDIMYLNKPHIGTDVLRNIVKNMREKIISNGGKFKYNTCMTDIVICNDILKGIEINNNEIINCDNLILAIGHSARDTFKMIYDRKINIEAKPFAIGIRIQHPQEMINYCQYGYNSSKLPNATYKLTYKSSNGRGVYSFCMCPGGYVVNSSSENKLLAINGMSYHSRDGENANSALVVTVNTNDFGNNPLSGIEYQRKLEAKAFSEGNGNIPIQLLKDFNTDNTSEKFGLTNPMFKGKFSFSNINNILPSYICESLKEAIINFNKKIDGYARDDSILAAIESRTSSPVRILRNDNFMSNIKGIYPCGEGAGYAGGITSAAIDGIKVAESIAKIYYR